MKKSDEHYDQLAKARFVAMDKMPYLASAIYALRPLKTDRFEGTAAVSNNGYFIFNPDNFFAQGEEVCGTIILHEAMHLINEHFERSEAISGVNHMQWNIAGDCEINDDLLIAGCEMGKCVLPRDFGFSACELAETYYGLLDDKKVEVQVCCGSGAGNPIPDEQDIVPQDGEGLKKEDIERIKDEVAAAIKEHEKRGGFIPGNLKRFADDRFKAKPIDWKRQLGKLVKHNVGVVSGILNPTYQKISRRQWSSKEIVFPAYVNPLPKIGILLDTSGSMTEEDLGKCLFQIGKIIGQLNVELWVAIVDAEVHSLQKANSVKQIEARLTGGGGTVFTEVVPMLDKLRCSCVVGLSDLYASFPAEMPKTPFIWVTPGKDHGQPPFGKVIEMV